MALPGVTTAIKDRFYTLTRTDVPAGPRVVAIATRDTASGTEGVVDYDAYVPRSEQSVIAAFGEGSGIHRAFLELVAGGAARIVLIALPANTADSALYTEAVFDTAFEAAEAVRPDIIACWGRGGHPNDWENPATPGNDEAFGFYADNTVSGSLTNNMAKLVADKCKEISDRTHPVFGVLGIKPFVGTGADATEGITAASVSTHLALANLTNHESTSFGENGAYVSVVAAEMIPQGYKTEFGYANGACSYAAAVSTLPSFRATTGKPIFNINAMRYNPTRVQQQGLIDKGVVPVTLDFNRIATWVDGLTFGRSTSDFTRLSTLRIIFDTLQLVRNAAESFVGEGATLHTRNALETAVTSALRNMKLAGALIDADFTILYIPRETRAVIDLSVRPAFELRNIDISISVQI